MAVSKTKNTIVKSIKTAKKKTKKSNSELNSKLNSKLNSQSNSQSNEVLQEIMIHSKELANSNKELMEKLLQGDQRLKDLEKTIRKFKKRDIDTFENGYSTKNEKRIKSSIPPLMSISKIQSSKTQLNTDTKLLKKEIIQKNHQINSQYQEIDFLKSELNREDRKFDMMRIELESKIGSLQDQLSALKKIEQEMLQKLEKQRKQVAEREKTINNLHIINADLKYKINNYDTELKKVFDDKKKIGEILEKTDKENELLKKELRNQKSHIYKLEDEMKLKEKTKVQAVDNIKEKEQVLNELQSDLATYREKTKILELTNKEVSTKLSLYEQKEKELTDQIYRQKEINKSQEYYYKKLLKKLEEKYTNKFKEIIKENTKEQITLRTDIELMKEKLFDKLFDRSHTLEKFNKTEEQTHISKIQTKPKNQPKYIVAHPNELIPLIKTAIHHGDSREEISKSILNSGYSPVTVKQAFDMI